MQSDTVPVGAGECKTPDIIQIDYVKNITNKQRTKKMLTKKHFKALTKIHAKALKAMKDNEPKTAYNIFEFGLRDFYQSINVNFDDFKFEKRTQKDAQMNN